jgi:hypothetical protein
VAAARAVLGLGRQIGECRPLRFLAKSMIRVRPSALTAEADATGLKGSALRVTESSAMARVEFG